jgi:uncharacterized protein YraI
LWVTTRDTLNLRTGPGTNFDVLTKVPHSTNVIAKARSVDGSWLRVTYNDLTGWLAVQFLNVAGDVTALPVGDSASISTPVGEDETVTAMNTAAINVRAEPSSSALSLGTLRSDSTILLTGRAGGVNNLWVRFTFEGQDAWVAAWLLEISGDVNALPELSSPQLGDTFNVYTDYTARDNHYYPSGWMADIGDITMNERWSEACHSGDTCIQITYTPQGHGPNECPYSPPCKWAGVYWLNEGWGNIPNAGFNLAGFTRLTFWARTDNPNMFAEFKVGGVEGEYPDSLRPARSTGVIQLSSEWTQYEIDLSNAELTHINGGFVWVTNWAGANGGGTLYLDDIQFLK